MQSFIEGLDVPKFLLKMPFFNRDGNAYHGFYQVQKVDTLDVNGEARFSYHMVSIDSGFQRTMEIQTVREIGGLDTDSKLHLCDVSTYVEEDDAEYNDFYAFIDDGVKMTVIVPLTPFIEGTDERRDIPHVVLARTD